jgi:predicted CXXCH cytochrome family protein
MGHGKKLTLGIDSRLKRFCLLAGVGSLLVTGGTFLIPSRVDARRPPDRAVELCPAGFVQPIQPPGTAKPQRNPETRAEPPTTVVAQESCATADCHGDTKQHEYLHGPLFVNACDACHSLKDPQTHDYGLVRPAAQLCVYCHEFDLSDDVMTHRPFQAGECMACHDPHGSSTPKILGAEHYSDMCLSCHEDLVGARNLVHGPAADGACNACHQPHAAPNRKLLEADGRDLCLRCHADVEIELETKRLVHDPVRGDCQLCHDPHATDTPSLLKNDPQSLCVGCHSEIEHTIETATTAHGAITTERSCLNCHSAHASDFPRLLKGEVMGLCFECHNKQIERADGSVIPNMKAIIETGTSLHGAIAAGSCVACHQIHGSGHQRLLVREYPNALYDQFKESEYALCFGCHDKALVISEQTTAATGFRNGSENLHFVHVKKGERGRTCRVCHDSHAAKRDNHIHETVPFGPGGWELPIRFERGDEGGRCASGCHESLAYSRDHPVEYPPEIKKKD